MFLSQLPDNNCLEQWWGLGHPGIHWVVGKVRRIWALNLQVWIKCLFVSVFIIQLILAIFTSYSKIFYYYFLLSFPFVWVYLLGNVQGFFGFFFGEGVWLLMASFKTSWAPPAVLQLTIQAPFNVSNWFIFLRFLFFQL